LPMKHQGQTTSETTSIVSGSGLGAGIGFSSFALVHNLVRKVCNFSGSCAQQKRT
jgi:hypothetical protein